jgi:O-antigen ligase
MFSISPLTGLGIGTFQQINIVVDKVIPGLVAVKTSGTYKEEVIRHSVEGGLHVHNVYLQLLVETGLVGTGLFLVFLVLPIRRGLPDKSSIHPVVRADYDTVLNLARFNKMLAFYLLIFLAVTGLTSGYTLNSPTLAWLFFVSLSRLVRQHMYLKNVTKKCFLDEMS